MCGSWLDSEIIKRKIGRENHKVGAKEKIYVVQENGDGEGGPRDGWFPARALGGLYSVRGVQKGGPWN